MAVACFPKSEPEKHFVSSTVRTYVLIPGEHVSHALNGNLLEDVNTMGPHELNVSHARVNSQNPVSRKHHGCWL